MKGQRQKSAWAWRLIEKDEYSVNFLCLQDRNLRFLHTHGRDQRKQNPHLLEQVELSR